MDRLGQNVRQSSLIWYGHGKVGMITVWAEISLVFSYQEKEDG